MSTDTFKGVLIYPFGLTGERQRARITGYCLTEDVLERVSR